MEDAYQTPQSTLTDHPTDRVADGKLYKISGIGVATFFGSVLAGGICMALNYRRMGRYADAKRTLAYSGAALAATLTLGFALPEGASANVALTLLPLVIVVQLAKAHQGRTIHEHAAAGGSLASNWSAFGISLLVILGIVVVTTVAVSALLLLGFDLGQYGADAR